MSFEVLILTLPIIFIVHDLEEIIFFRKWLDNNMLVVGNRFPRLQPVLSRAAGISTPAFSLAVAEELLLLLGISYSALYFQWYYLWVSAFMAFFIHLFVHIGQCLALRSYTPGVVTSIILLPVCYYMFNRIRAEISLSAYDLVLLSISGALVMIANLLFAHRLTKKLGL